MQTKQLETVNQILAKEGYAFASYFKTIFEELAREGDDDRGRVHRWLDQLIVEYGAESGLKDKAIEKAKERIARQNVNIEASFSYSLLSGYCHLTVVARGVILWKIK